MAPDKKQFILNAFVMQAPGHLNPGLFKYPKDKGRSYNDIKHWMELAQKLEKAKFHAMFFADGMSPFSFFGKLSFGDLFICQDIL